MDSKVATFPLLKLGIKPEKVVLETKPDPKYSGKPDSTLVDGKSGSLNRGDKEYLGFVNQNFQALFQLEKNQKISQLTLSFLEDVEKGILAPEYVEVFGGEDKNNLIKLGRITTVFPLAKRPAAKDILQINFPERTVRFIRIKAKNIGSLPSWVPLQKTTKASIFIDEVSLE